MMNKISREEIEKKLKKERVEICMSCKRFVKCENIGRFEECGDFVEVENKVRVIKEKLNGSTRI